ncbi:MAG: hypothetical protein DLM73_06005 [Chthoniobacterales bacterium]|nr:MAG: hypothetical protein DLM73_06005 [Chthoniobacterales bacterium]
MADASLESQIDKIRREIEEHGESTVGCEELSVLCPGAALHSSRWDAIAQIAIGERWAFTLLPDESVSFKNL